MVTRDRLEEVIKTYGTAWETRDPDLITTIFTPDATYHERAFKEAHKTRKGIRQYWIDKVVGEQENIRFTLLHTYQDGNTAIAEWEAEFDKLRKGEHTRMREVAILEFEGDLIKSLREYWQAENTLR